MEWYEEVDGVGTRHKIARRVDPTCDVAAILERLPVRWDCGRSWTYAELVAEMVRRSKTVVNEIDETIERARVLFERQLADRPPDDVAAWRRAMILSWNHAEDLTVIMRALDHNGSPGGRHDLDDAVRGRWLRTRMHSSEPWFASWVASVDDDAIVSVGFLNPHLSASLYRWGDNQGGVQNAMDAHRLAEHHLGTPEAPTDWVERAANFIVHHLPREHYGIRHEPLGDWSRLEEVLESDPAIRPHPIGKLIARDIAPLMKALEEYGRITPWHRLKAHVDDASAGDYDFAARVLQTADNDRAADDGLDTRALTQARMRLEELKERAVRDPGIADACRSFVPDLVPKHPKRIERPELERQLFADHDTTGLNASTELEYLVREGWIAEAPDPDRGVYDTEVGAYVIRKQDEMLALAPLAQLATALLGLFAGLHLWPYAAGSGVIQLAFIWMRIREDRAFISKIEARILRELIAHKLVGRTVDEIIATLAVDRDEPVELSHTEVQAALDRFLKLPKLDAEPIAVVRCDGNRWFPLRV